MTIDPASAIVAILACSFVAVLWSKLRSSMRSRRARVRSLRAVAGEEQAARLLEANGFEILERQACQTYALTVGDRQARVALRADYIVGRGDRQWVAEVKTGNVAPKIESPATRRQLLEYRIAFDVDGVLLVDVESNRIHEIGFPGLPTTTRATSNFGFGWLLVPALIALAWLVLPALR